MDKIKNTKEEAKQNGKNQNRFFRPFLGSAVLAGAVVFFFNLIF
jgi:hypothetical protein